MSLHRLWRGDYGQIHPTLVFGHISAAILSELLNSTEAVSRYEREVEVSPSEAIAFVRRHGVVLQGARGPVPSLAEAIAGGPIRGSWWGHGKGRVIFHASQAISESPEVLVCKLIEDKVTYVHRRLWPALVKLAPRFRKSQLAKVWDEHTKSGAHASQRIAFPEWVPSEVLREAEALSTAEAEQLLSALLTRQSVKKRRIRRRKAGGLSE